jgi:transposase
MLYEFGHVFPQGLAQMKAIEELVKNPTCDLPMLVIEESQDMLRQIVAMTEQIEARTKKLKAIAAETDMARRLQTMPGVGPMTALSIEAFAPDMVQFKCGWDFAAWLGLVPRQHSSGGKDRLGRVSKTGQADIRRLLIIGAMSKLVGRIRHKISAKSWVGRMLARKPKMLVGIALANKMARQIWAMLVKKEDYREPASAAWA